MFLCYIDVSLSLFLCLCLSLSGHPSFLSLEEMKKNVLR